MTETVEVIPTGLKDEEDEYSTYFSDSFKWMDCIINCLVPTKKSNNTVINYLVLSLFIIFVLVYCGFQYYLQVTGWNLYRDIVNIIWCFFVFFLVSSRILSILYSFKYFNRAWTEYESTSSRMQLQPFAKQIKCLNILYILLPVLYIILDIVIVCLEADNLLAYYKNDYAIYIFVKSIGRIFVYYPQLISTVIQSIIILKYYLYLYQLLDTLKNMNETSNYDIQHISETYDNCYKMFIRDYHWTLSWSVRLYLFAEILFFWDSLSFTGLLVMFLIICKISFVFGVYFYPASMLEDMYTKCNTELWKMGQIYLKKKENVECKYYYNYVLQYIQKYPIYVTFGRIIVSKWNVLKFCAGLIITRGISYAFEEWIN